MLGISLLQGMVFYASVATLYRQAVGVSLFEISLIECASLLAGVLLEIPWGLTADRIGYKKTMILCSFLYFLSKFVFWKADGFGMLMLERLLLAVVSAGLSGVNQSMLYLSYPKEAVQKVFGRYAALGEAGVLISAAAYTLFMGDDYRAAAFWTMIAYGAAALLSMLLVEVRPEEKAPLHPFGEFKRCFLHLRSVHGLLPLIVCSSLFGEVCHMVTVFLNQLQYEKCGWGAALIGTAYILSTLAGLAGAFSDRFTRRLGETRSGSLLMVLCGAACLIMALLPVGWISLGCIIVMCLASALYFPLFSTIENRCITIDSRATALSVSALMDSAVSIGANLTLGRMADFSLSLSLLGGGALCLMCAFIYLGALRRILRKAPV